MTDPHNEDTVDLHPGMMGDGTEEQNLGQEGDPTARITEDEVVEAFEGDDDDAEEEGADEPVEEDA